MWMLSSLVSSFSVCALALRTTQRQQSLLHYHLPNHVKWAESTVFDSVISRGFWPQGLCSVGKDLWLPEIPAPHTWKGWIILSWMSVDMGHLGNAGTQESCPPSSEPCTMKGIISLVPHVAMTFLKWSFAQKQSPCLLTCQGMISLVLHSLFWFFPSSTGPFFRCYLMVGTAVKTMAVTSPFYNSSK